MAEIRYGKLQALNQEIEETQQKLHEMQGDKAMIKEEVDAEDIADVVSRWTGIPVSKMLQSEKDKLLHLEAELHQRVIGQDEAIEPYPMPYAVAVPDCKTRNVLSAHSFSWEPPV